MAIFQNERDTSNIITPHMNISVSGTDFINAARSSIDDICAADCKMNNGQIIIIVAIYISPNQPIKDILIFLKRILWAYTIKGSQELDVDFYQRPMIIAGDFNTEFNYDRGKQIIHYFQTQLGLCMNNNPNVGTTRYGTTIDAVFSRNLNDMASQVFATYFSYHKPIISVVPKSNSNALAVETFE